MGYFIRVLGTSLDDVPLADLRIAADPALIETSDEDAPWQQVVLKHHDGAEIAVIERNPVVEGELGAEELQEFLEEVPLYDPQSSVEWLRQYLPSVKVIYAFQLLSGTDINDGWTPLHRVYSAVWRIAGGILQADGEGFSNEDGYTILWQFSDSAKGAWNVGLLTGDRWTHFELDLGSCAHREAFKNGQIPEGVTILE
jgi:hypothetical protein